MTDSTCRSTSRAPRLRPTAGPLDDTLLRPRRGAASGGCLRPGPDLARRTSGSTTDDHDLGDGSRDVLGQDLADERAHLAAVEAHRSGRRCRRSARFERDLELHNLRRSHLPTDEVRTLGSPIAAPRHASATACSCLFARDYAPLRRSPRRDRRPAGSHPGVPRAVARPGRPVRRSGGGRRWRSRRRAPAARPDRRDRRRRATDRPTSRATPSRGCRRDTASAAIEGYRGLAARAPSRTGRTTGRSAGSDTTRWSACGPSTASTPTTILEIGWQRLAEEHGGARRRPRGRSTRASDVHDVIDRVKADGPADFDERAGGLSRRDDPGPRAPHRARPRDGPDDERIDVIATPEYLRSVMPFAAYFAPAAFDRDAEGDLRRHAVGRRRPGRDAGAQLRARSATRASTRRTRATTCSSIGPAATRR